MVGEVVERHVAVAQDLHDRVGHLLLGEAVHLHDASEALRAGGHGLDEDVAGRHGGAEALRPCHVAVRVEDVERHLRGEAVVLTEQVGRLLLVALGDEGRHMDRLAQATEEVARERRDAVQLRRRGVDDHRVPVDDQEQHKQRCDEEHGVQGHVGVQAEVAAEAPHEQHAAAGKAEQAHGRRQRGEAPLQGRGDQAGEEKDEAHIGGAFDPGFHTRHRLISRVRQVRKRNATVSMRKYTTSSRRSRPLVKLSAW